MAREKRTEIGDIVLEAAKIGASTAAYAAAAAAGAMSFAGLSLVTIIRGNDDSVGQLRDVFTEAIETGKESYELFISRLYPEREIESVGG